MDKNIIIERLYRDHKDHVYNFVARMANDPELALDITQQTFVKALSDKNVSQIANPKAYLFTIARNTLFNEFKRKKASSLEAIEDATDFEAIDESENIHETTELQDIQAKVEKSIKRMPAKIKELMILRYTEDLTIKEISVVTGRTLSDVKVNLHRARIKFESAFTNEMYAKIAASRDQCEVLTTLLAPHINTEIPDEYLLIVDNHITDCAICSEDAEQLKRSRILFNLGALLSAPAIFDQMMSDAMASEFHFLDISSKSQTTPATSATTTAPIGQISKMVAAKAISSSSAKLIGYYMVAGFSVLLILVTLFTDIDDDEDSAVVDEQASVTTSTSGSTAAAKIDPAAILDPNATSMVNFKALNKQTGKSINQGLKWQIFNRANNRGEAVTGKPKLIETSTSANLSLIMDAGFYLAKVTYQGKTLETHFLIKDDTPLNIQINFGNANTKQLTKAPTIKLPTIHIRRKDVGTKLTTPLKLNWDLCVSTINSYLSFQKQNPAYWANQEKSIREGQPDFDLNRGLIAEPKWSKLIQNIEDEYFSGDKYAIYKKGSHYTVSQNGSCKLIKTDYDTADIDDGESRYSINFKKKTAYKSISAVALQKEVDGMYKNMADENPLMMQAMGKMLGTAMLGKEGSAQQQQSLAALSELTELTKVAGTESVAGETCEYTKMGVQTGVKICYWKTMHEYPSYIKREIVLKTSINLGKKSKPFFFGKATNVAILFEKDIKLKDSIFSIPSNIRIIDDSADE